MPLERRQFTFYASFDKALMRIRKRTDRCLAYDAIVHYALYGVEPKPDELPNSAAIAFELVRPNLDTSRKRAENGRKGGLAQANAKQNGSEKEKEIEIEIENEVEVEIENEKDY